MSDLEFTTDNSADTEPTANTDDTDLELLARIERLEAENERLRTEYARARQAQYRRTALALVVVGIVSVVGGLLLPDSREVLIAIGATGIFGGVLTVFLTPEQFVPASVGERVYAAGAANSEAIASALELREEYVYLPGTEAVSGRLYIPQRAEYDVPEPGMGPFVTDPASRGLVLEATGTSLFEEFRRSVTGGVASAPVALASQLSDALVEQFELVERATPDVDPADGRLTIAVTGSTFGPLDRFDHPVSSFLAIGTATALDQPVTLEVAERSATETWFITCWFDADSPDEKTVA